MAMSDLDKDVSQQTELHLFEQFLLFVLFVLRQCSENIHPPTKSEDNVHLFESL